MNFVYCLHDRNKLIGYLLVELLGCGLCKRHTGLSCHMLAWHQPGMNTSEPFHLEEKKVNILKPFYVFKTNIVHIVYYNSLSEAMNSKIYLFW